MVSTHLSQTSQTVFMFHREAKSTCLLAQFHTLELQEIHVRWKGPQEVQDVMSAVVSNDSLALDTRAEFNLLICIVDDFVRKDFKLLSSFVEQLQILGMGQNCLPKVYGTVYH